MLVLEIVLAAIALSVLALHFATLGRGVAAVLVAALLVVLLLQVTLTSTAPPAGSSRSPLPPLVDVATSMAARPAADAPSGP